MAYPQIEEQGATGSDIVYADLDIDFLEKCRAFATKPDCYEPTEYADVATTLEMIEEPDYINVGEFSYDHLQ
ncbi:hypothetical protein DPMN_102116 [Dreissena polymorpha]|uniref:Uncharacterized protein n=2 Tax=Dreissena polymorpha TaxID=45954 RepID=A0A9D4R8W9_DREPO|nr:hypothetical protein DPMN_102116 [Dreissena polymorpha]